MQMQTVQSLDGSHGKVSEQVVRRDRARSGTPWRFIGTLMARIVLARATRRALRELEQVDDRLLAAIGLTRSDIRSSIRLGLRGER